MGAMTDKEKLDFLTNAIRQTKCERYDRCRESGCMGGGHTCYLHSLLDFAGLRAKERLMESADRRNVKFLRKENKALKARLEEFKLLLAQPLNTEDEEDE